MKSEIEKTIEKELRKYKVEEIKISDKKYPLRLIPELCDEDLNIFEGFLFVEAENKSKVSDFKRYKPPVSGYTSRVAFIFYNDYLLIKDYRRNRHIIKTLRKTNKTFLSKLKKALNKPDEENFNKLFDRTDVIEEFYILYQKTREYLLKNIKGIPEEEKREEFVDNFMMQMLTLWYLQERGFFNSDRNYFITKFKKLRQKKLFNGFKNYYEFLTYLFEKISGHEDKQYYEDRITGKVVVIGPAVFLNGEHSKAISIPDKCFYKDEMTDILINTPPKKVSQEVPLLNLFESRDWTEGNIDEFVLGAIYEKLITYMERKKLGAYYTPEEITSYICKNTIEPYLVDRVSEQFDKSFETIDQIIESNDKEIILYFFEQLKEIKILDPAVGSAHFLESAINVLVSIYEKIWEKVKELGIKKGLEIVAVDEKGRVKKINLLGISDEERLKLFVKFFIILSKNVYGVDINSSALKVARARLFLTLAKHFEVGRGKDIFIRFPNVHFNLREGNSLIGYVELKREKEKAKGQLTLDFFVKEKEEEVTYITEAIKIVSDLKEYLKETAKALGIPGDIVKDVEKLNEILSKKEIKWVDFQYILKTKEKLISILIASLNSQYASPLNELLNQITELFNQKLDEKFAKEHNIDLAELKQIKTLHWVFEFPEVSLDLDKGGFDVVVGNPPYVRHEDINHIFEGVDYKAILSKLYEPFDNTFDFSMFFILQSLQVCRNEGYHSFIITNKWLRAKYGKSIRKFLKENITVRKVVDFNRIRVFVGATVDTLVYVIQKKKPEKENLIFYNRPLSWKNLEQGGYKVRQSGLGNDTWNFVNEEMQEIKKWIEKVGKPLKNWNVKINYGIKTGYNEAFVVDDGTRKRLIEEDPKSAELIKPLLRGRDIGRYYVEWDRKWIIVIPSGFTKNLTKRSLSHEKAEEIFKENYPAIYKHFEQFRYIESSRGKGLINRDDQGDYWWELRACNYYPEFEKPKIVWQEISIESMYFWDNQGIFYLPNNAYLISNVLRLYLIILNSKLIEIIFSLISQFLCGGFRHTKQYIEKISIHLPENSKPCETLTDLLLFLNATEERREKLKEIINFFDRQIADSLVYELYFREKFHEDGLYPKPKEYLLEAISKHLKPINYDRWAELYWKKQLEGELTEEEEKELSKLEKDNMETIEVVYNRLKEDKEIHKWIEKIKSHDWVKVIEGEI
ncbi:N-6 DNA methylase [Peptococcaceae bacterium]|nr:N-6 DNA methylase [Peptococcaceae bacterium]